MNKIGCWYPPSDAPSKSFDEEAIDVLTTEGEPGWLEKVIEKV